MNKTPLQASVLAWGFKAGSNKCVYLHKCKSAVLVCEQPPRMARRERPVCRPAIADTPLLVTCC
jgi:hypothetical protein